MAHATSLHDHARPTRPAHHHVAGPVDVVTELCTALFSRFRGYDQRVRARQYMDGLLRAQGRKSIANIAASVGVPGDEQRLHHFVNSSRWDVGPVRGALAAFLGGNGPVPVWVALPVSIPKAGRRMVGVFPHFSAEEGHRVVGQQAFSMWYASERMVAPVSWRLRVPDPGPGRRRTVEEFPDGLATATATAENCVANLLDDVRAWQVAPRLIVADARGDDERAQVSQMFRHTSPVAVRISGRTLLTVDEQRRGAGHTRRLTPAHAALDQARRTRSAGHLAHGGNPPVTATASVRLPGPRDPRCPGPAGGLALLGVWHEPRRAPDELWLTNVDEPASPALLRATRLAHRVDAGWRARGKEVGLRDYEGRSFQGWHRHMTLASCAYAMAELRSAEASGGSSLDA
ncbi:IS701 family transposase [Streptomyces sp. NPDC096310]|uniref:IS701 family transposase n=1 Tax=Streptomyces sp. NPDC096310 TaxID=3366082 RepID=UPI0038080A10